MSDNTDNRYTVSGLPKITEGVWQVLDRDHKKRTDEGAYQFFCQGIVAKIYTEDRQLHKIINKIVENSKISEELTNYFVTGFLYAYELLRRQAEVYKLEEGIK